ncbi:MAG TPA: pyridoxamine 5'-phosphate oxidase family protein [Nitrospira sp.]|nr:pyridoxamine 5'-phosphate oxidase family protein [Nitrospira sp.]
MTNDEVQKAWLALAQDVRTGVLLTLRNGRPFGSHVPYLFGSDWTRAYLHLSRLALHTQHLLADPRVSLFVADADRPDKNPLSLKRMNLQGEAALLPSSEESYRTVTGQYLARFPTAAPMFGFSDFSLWELKLKEAHLVLGFGEAYLSTAAAPSAWTHQKPEWKFPANEGMPPRR